MAKNPLNPTGVSPQQQQYGQQQVFIVPQAQQQGGNVVYLQPVFAQPASNNQVVVTNVQARRPPPNRWSDSICDWPKNLFPSCYCVCCCLQGMYITAQSKKMLIDGCLIILMYFLFIVSQKTGFISFKSALWAYLGFWIVALIGQAIFGAAIILWLPMLFSFGFALALRLHIARRQNITECGEVGECCCGFWCWYCSVAQSKSLTLFK